MIGIFGKNLNYRGDFAQNFIFVLLFTSLLNFKWAQEFALNTIMLLFNLDFSLKYQSHDILDCCCMRFMLPEDLANVDPRHEFIWNVIAYDVDDDVEMR